MKTLAANHNLLTEREGVVLVPFLVKGRLVIPPELTRAEVEKAFAECDESTPYVKLANAQLLRERIIDRRTMAYTGETLYQVLPPVDPLALIERDVDKLVAGPYALTVEEVLAYLRDVSAALAANWDLAERVAALCRRTSEHPDAFLDGAFVSLAAGLDPASARCMIDNELAVWGMPGSRFLDGWVEVPAAVIPGLAPLLAQALPGPGVPAAALAAPAALRAMPTRQLHITAGNAPQVPIISALRLILTKSAGVIKLPFGSTLPAALLALAAVSAAPDHPLIRNMSLVYWQGGDEAVENVLFAPAAFDRIVVWGAPEAVSSVRARARFTRVVCFNPRYGVSLIGREAFADDLDRVAAAAATDTLIYNQKACTASLVHYVEATEAGARAYGERLAAALARWDELAPQLVPPATRGRLKQMRRGRYARAEWLLNTAGGEYRSGVAIMPEEFDILEHPMCRLAVVRPVADLQDALAYLHEGVSTVGVYPEARRLALRDAIAGRGVSSILPLGQCERLFPAAPHDGMLVLSELVDWKVG